MIWRFSAVARVNVQCPRALEAGVSRILGKAFRDGEYVLAEPAVYDLSKRDAAALRGFFARCLRRGELLPADAATATDFGTKEPS